MSGLHHTDAVMRCPVIPHTDDVTQTMRNNIISRWAGAPKPYDANTVPNQITAKINAIIRVLLNATPVVPQDTNLTIVTLMRICIEDVAKKRVPQTLKLSSQFVYQNVLF